MLVLLLSSGGFPPQNTPMKTSGGCARELAAWGSLIGLRSPLEDVKSWESDANIGSQVGKSLLRYDLDSGKKSLWLSRFFGS